MSRILQRGASSQLVGTAEASKRVNHTIDNDLASCMASEGHRWSYCVSRKTIFVMRGKACSRTWRPLPNWHPVKCQDRFCCLAFDLDERAYASQVG